VLLNEKLLAIISLFWSISSDKVANSPLVDAVRKQPKKMRSKGI